MNVFVTTLSTLNKDNLNIYSVEEKNGIKKYCAGISANEAGAKYILSTEIIDKIVITGSDSTYTAIDMKLINGLCNMGSFNTSAFLDFVDAPPLHSNRELLYLVCQLSDFLNHKDKFSENNISEYNTYPKLEPISANLNAKILFVPLMNGDSENLFSIIKAIRGNTLEEDVTLFIDVQGGNRTDSYVMNAVFSILDDNDDGHVKIGKVIATDFSPANHTGQIIDETARYKISELVSGMNAFIRYGKAHAIASYLKKSGTQDKRIIKISEQMIKIEEAISVCDIEKLKKSIISLNKHFYVDDTYADDTASEIFKIIESEICRDYGKLIELDNNDNLDTLELIDWCARKRFAHQALVILETEIPDMMYDSGILFYDPICSDKLNIYNCFGSSDKKLEKGMRNETDSHYLVRAYPNMSEPTSDFKEIASNKYPLDRKYYSKRLRFIIHEIYYNNKWGDIKMYSALEEEELTALLEKYYVLVLRRNEVSHSDECNEYRWKLSTIISEILDFTRMYRELSVKAQSESKREIQKNGYKKYICNTITGENSVVNNSPVATSNELIELSSHFNKL